MKFPELELPDWVWKSRLGLFAGMECYAQYNHLVDPDNIFVKETRCNRCMACCSGIEWGKGVRLPRPVVNGYCVHLEQSHAICTLAGERPLVCCYDPNIEREFPQCCITHKKVPIIK